MDAVLIPALVILTVVSVASLAMIAKLRSEFRSLAAHGAVEGGEELMLRANDSLDAANSALNQIAASIQALSTQSANAAAVDQQRYEGLLRGLDRIEAKSEQARQELLRAQAHERESVETRLERLRETMDGQLRGMRESNEEKLEVIRATVDEKLASTLNDRLGASFKQVSSQLEAVYRGLGDMQNLAAGVGDLKRVLSNVKNRGILGEVQLGAILADILAPEQYEQNVATKPGASGRVEFAVKIPVEGSSPVMLPIDSKFPAETYGHLRERIEEADADGAAQARKALVQRVRQEARDISEKYLSVPATTNFAIMFLPFEGLYAEVVDTPGLVESLQRDYRVNVAGPSTMAAILNSLQMSYQTFAFQRRADEIQRVLAAVKAEFPKYQAELRRALKQIETAGRTVDGIINTRTNVIERKLRDVTALEDGERAAEVLGIDNAASMDGIEGGGME